MSFRTEMAVDDFLNNYIKRIPGIGVANSNLLIGYIKEEILEMELPDLKEGMVGLMIPKFRYIIKNEDLPILESLFDGLRTAAGANFFIAVSTGDINQSWAAAIGIFSSLYKLYKKMKNKGKILPSLEFQVLLCLKNHPEGLEFDYLQFLLERDNVFLSELELQQLLDSLGKSYLHDGSKMELVILEGKLYKAKGI